MEFIRYGNLTSQSHPVYGTMDDWFHVPPTKYGFYAFPKGFVELFLIGGTGSGSLQNGRYKYFRDSTGKKVYANNEEFKKLKKRYKKLKLIRQFEYEDYFDDYDADNDPDDIEYNRRKELANYDEEYKKCAILIENPPIHFKYNGLIWHHLFLQDESKDKLKHYYIKKVNSWVLTDIKTYEKCLKREQLRRKYSALYKDSWIKYSGTGRINLNVAGMPTFYSKDEFEVYIESIQNDNKTYNKK